MMRPVRAPTYGIAQVSGAFALRATVLLILSLLVVYFLSAPLSPIPAGTFAFFAYILWSGYLLYIWRLTHGAAGPPAEIWALFSGPRPHTYRNALTAALMTELLWALRPLEPTYWPYWIYVNTVLATWILLVLLLPLPLFPQEEGFYMEYLTQYFRSLVRAPSRYFGAVHRFLFFTLLGLLCLGVGLLWTVPRGARDFAAHLSRADAPSPQSSGTGVPTRSART